MKIIKSISLICLCFPLLIMKLNAQEVVQQTYAKGSKIAAFQAKDQHEKEFKFEKGIRYLLVSFDMSTGKVANEALNAKGADFLPSKKAVFIANIYGMPKVGRVFALPKMKKYAHRIILGDAKNLLDPFPSEKKMVTVISLDANGTIKNISYWNPKTQRIEDVLK
jgi:hypothetical protein